MNSAVLIPASASADRLSALFRRAGAGAQRHPLLPLLQTFRAAPAVAPRANAPRAQPPVCGNAPLDVAALARRVHQLPPLPQAVTEVMLALHSETLSAQRSIDLIERDQALAARTLRLANSAFYGAPGRVGTIGDAVRMLGLRTVAGVLTAAAMHQALRVDGCRGFDFPLYWRHAIGCGLAARALASAVSLDADEAFLAGLMHDVGQLAMAVFEPERAAEALALARDEDLCAEAAELAVLGVSHACVGALVAAHWRFPDSVSGAISRHHAPEPSAGGPRASLSGLLQLADAVVHALDLDGDAAEAVPEIDLEVWQRLGLGAEQALQILSDVETGTREMSAILQHD